MHDAKGRPLAVGDTVMVPCTVVEVQAAADYCNVTLDSIALMAPGYKPVRVTSINTKQMLRANEGDDLGFEVVHADNHVTIQ